MTDRVIVHDDRPTVVVHPAAAPQVVSRDERPTITQSTQGPAGPPGAPGLAGPAGGAYVHIQGSPAAVWEFDHPLGYTPNITVEDSTHRIVEPDITYAPGHVTLDFGGSAMSGWAYLS